MKPSIILRPHIGLIVQYVMVSGVIKPAVIHSINGASFGLEVFGVTVDHPERHVVCGPDMVNKPPGTWHYMEETMSEAQVIWWSNEKMMEELRKKLCDSDA